MDAKTNTVAVLIPCYNEGKTIAKVVADFKAAVPGAVIYVYDNNSSDGTGEIAKAAGAVVRCEKRQGKGNVVRAMFRDIEADCFIMVDGDDTYPAESCAEMARLVENGADMVVGDRLSSTYFTENKRMFHNSGNVLVRKLVNLFFDSKVSDIMTGYRAFSSRFVKTFAVLSTGFEIETEMTIHCLDKNMRLETVPVSYRDRPLGSESKLNTVQDGFRVLFTIFNLFREYKPLAFFGCISIVLFLLGSIMMIPIFITYFETGLVPQFPTLIAAGFGMVAAIQFFVCGLILDSVSRKNKQEFEIQQNIFTAITNLKAEKK